MPWPTPSSQVNPQPPPEPVWRVRIKDKSPAPARNWTLHHPVQSLDVILTMLHLFIIRNYSYSLWASFQLLIKHNLCTLKDCINFSLLCLQCYFQQAAACTQPLPRCQKHRDNIPANGSLINKERTAKDQCLWTVFLSDPCQQVPTPFSLMIEADPVSTKGCCLGMWHLDKVQVMRRIYTPFPTSIWLTVRAHVSHTAAVRSNGTKLSAEPNSKEDIKLINCKMYKNVLIPQHFIRAETWNRI